MNRRVPLTLSTLLGLGFISTGWSQPTDSRLTEMTYALMKRVAADAKTSPRMSVSEREIEVQRRRVRLFPVIENRRTMAGQHAIGVRFDVSVDGRTEPNLSAGAVGIAESPEAAERTAIGEWYLQFGQPMFEAIAGSTPKFRFGEYSVYHGPLGIRGGTSDLAADPALSPQRTISTIKASLPDLNRHLHVVHATVVVGADGKVDGEIRIDGSVSAEALRALVRQPWPKHTTPYMYKQSFVLQ
jgi:Family of unknown function (DUF6348)